MGKNRNKLKTPDKGSDKFKNTGVAAVNYDEATPVFCFKHLDSGHGLDMCESQELCSLVKQLRSLSQLTWRQIKAAPRHGLGTENIPISKLTRPKPKFLSDQIDSLMAFRFDGKKPMLGHRDRDVFHICFLDPKFNLYDHG